MKEERTFQITTEGQYVKIARTAKHYELEMKAEDFLTKITISGDADKIAAFEKDYNDPTINY